LFIDSINFEALFEVFARFVRLIFITDYKRLKVLLTVYISILLI